MRHIEERNFMPRLGQGDLPTLADASQLTRVSFLRAGETWNIRMPGYHGMLFSLVRDPIAEGIFVPILDENDGWYWLANVQRYRNMKTGDVVNDRKFVQLRDRFTDAQNLHVTAISTQMAQREITLHEWVRQMGVAIKHAHLAMWMLGSGGYNTIGNEMVDSLTDTLRTQYSYFHSFAQEILKENRPDANRQSLQTRAPVTMRGLINRAIMYVESSTASAERGRFVTYQAFPYQLPAYPGDGSMICLTNCRCHWRIRLIPGEDSFFHAFWRLKRRDRRNCETCIQYAEQWNPFTVLRF